MGELVKELREAGWKQKRFGAGSMCICSNCWFLLSVRSMAHDTELLRAQEQRDWEARCPQGDPRDPGGRRWQPGPKTTCSVQRKDVTQLQGDGRFEVGKIA